MTDLFNDYIFITILIVLSIMLYKYPNTMRRCLEYKDFNKNSFVCLIYNCIFALTYLVLMITNYENLIYFDATILSLILAFSLFVVIAVMALRTSYKKYKLPKEEFDRLQKTENYKERMKSIYY